MTATRELSTLVTDETRLVRAWVNFNGGGTVAIRASYNVSSITDNGVGLYTLNFLTPMPDINYSVAGSCGTVGARMGIVSDVAGAGGAMSNHQTNALALGIYSWDGTGISLYDHTAISIIIFR